VQSFVARRAATSRGRRVATRTTSRCREDLSPKHATKLTGATTRRIRTHRHREQEREEKRERKQLPSFFQVCIAAPVFLLGLAFSHGRSTSLFALMRNSGPATTAGLMPSHQHWAGGTRNFNLVIRSPAQSSIIRQRRMYVSHFGPSLPLLFKLH